MPPTRSARARPTGPAVVLYSHCKGGGLEIPARPMSMTHFIIIVPTLKAVVGIKCDNLRKTVPDT